MADSLPAEAVFLPSEPAALIKAAPAQASGAFRIAEAGGQVIAAAETAPARPAGPGAPVNPPLAMGLSGIADWSTEQPFIDLMKSARPWTGHLPGQWGGWDEAALTLAGCLDAAGWPKCLPKAITGISTIILTEQPEQSISLAGRYRIAYRGEGEIRIEGRVSNVIERKGEIWFNYAPGEGLVLITISSTDPRGTGNYIRDISIVKETNIPAFEAGAFFNPAWIAKIDDLRAVRFMDWMATNNSTIAHWDERPLPADYTYGRRGVPLEIMVALANAIGADPWFTLPHKADDAYVQAFATYVRDHLAPQRKVYVEYSNELWNWMFDQTHWAQEQARARWGRKAGDDAWMQFAGMRAAQIADIWRGAYGAAADDRLIAVVSTQTGWQGLEQPLLLAPLWVAEDPKKNRPPVASFDAYAVTGYFGNQLGNEKADTVLGWIAEGTRAAQAAADARGLKGAARDAAIAADRFDLATTRAAADLRDGSVTGGAGDSIAALADKLWPYQAQIARENGLELVMYEGGTHVLPGAQYQDNADLVNFFNAFNYSPEMGALYETLLADWRKSGGTLFNAFVDVAGPSQFGSWGALRTLDDDNPRWDALEHFNRTVPAWWESRPKDAFDEHPVKIDAAALTR